MNIVKKPLVYVFMSTFNGEKYIQTQIDSIIKQKDVDVHLWIRDDESTDGTVDIINNNVNSGKVTLITGENLGFEKSFAVISRINNEADYFAFSDQDDEWDLDRLDRAIKYLSKYDGPALYGSNLWITDEDLNIEKSLYTRDETKRISYLMCKYGIFGENMYACTMVWNKGLQSILMEHVPNVRVSQDVWTQLVAEIVGAKVMFDPKETIKHRIHRNNTAGIAKSNFQRLKKVFRIYIFSGISTKSEIVNEALSQYEKKDVAESKDFASRTRIRELVKDYQNGFVSKKRLVLSNCLREKPLKRWLFSLFLVLINKY